MPLNEDSERGSRFTIFFRAHAARCLFSLCIVFLFSRTSFAYGQTLYDYKVIAQTGNSLPGTGTILDLGEGPSINDLDKVAFIALDEPGIHGRVIVVNDGAVEKNFQIPPTERIGAFVQINNQDQVVWWRKIEAPGSQLDQDTLVQRLDTANSGEVIARGTLTDWFNTPWDYILPQAALNNNGLVFFTGDLDPNKSSGGTVLASRNGGSGPYQMSPALNNFPTFYPMASDIDRVVIRSGDSPTNSLKVFIEPTLDPVQALDVATSVDFNAIGNKPGISDDGRVVVFMGDSKTEGPGIYMVTINPQNQTVRFKAITLPLGSNLDYRVAVNHSQLSQLNEYLVTYMVADAGGSRALYSVRIDVTNPFSPQIAAPDLVADTGNPLQGLPSLSIVQDIQINDPVNNHGQLAFWVLTDTAEAIIHASCADVDGDALCDSWETNGIRDVNNNMLLDLPAMGADPSVKDIFIEVDYMESSDGHTHQPSDVAMEFVIRAFFNAPVAAPPVTCTPGDPKNCNGIRLHIDNGQTSIMDPQAVDPVQGTVWGTLSESTKLAHTINFGTNRGAGSACTTDNAIGELEDIKLGSTNGVLNFRPERTPVFHYVIFAHNNCSGGSGGFTPIYIGGATSHDSVLTLSRSPAPNTTIDIWDQAGTFMHEVGHQLGLNHGGGATDKVNWKPNYLSIMNYSFQKRGLPINSAHPEHPGASYPGVIEGYFDFSSFEPNEIAVLDENMLDENTGLQISPANPALAGFGTYYYCFVDIESPVDDITLPIDWNCNNGAPETGVIDDINIGLSVDTTGNGKTTLQSHNDWANLVYSGNAIGAAGLGAAPIGLEEEADFSGSVQLQARYNVRVANPIRLVLPPGGSGTYQFIVENTGNNTDTYSLQATSSMGWAQVGAIPASVTLAPGATVSVPIDITLPTVFNLNDADELTLIASSQSNPLLINSGTVITTVDSDADGLTDADEAALGTNPALVDTDGDGYDDGIEVSAGTDPLDNTSHPPADGDVNADGAINAGDSVIMLRIVLGEITPSIIALAHGDLYPQGAPDGVIDLSDLIVHQRLVLQ